MKKLRVIWALAVLLPGLLTPVVCQAAASREEFSPQGNPDMPWYVIPGRFLFQGNYYTHLNLTELRIDHVSDDSRCTRRNRVFMISAGYLMPIGNHLGAGQLEVPFLSADRVSFSRLEPAAVGDYVLHLQKGSQQISSLAELSISARF